MQKRLKFIKLIYTMDAFIKNIGAIIVLIGVAVLAIPQLCGFPSNSYLGIGVLIMIIGIIATIVIGRVTEK